MQLVTNNWRVASIRFKALYESKVDFD